MNEYNLANELEKGAKICEDHGTIALRVIKAADILRQQAERITELEQAFSALYKKYKENCASNTKEIELEIKPTSNLRFVKKIINRADGHIEVKILQQWWSTRDSESDEEDIALDINGEWRDIPTEKE